MSYSSGRFQARPLSNVGTITGTATASGTNAGLTGADLKMAAPKFNRRSVVNAVKVVSSVVPANWVGLLLNVKNGTDTIAVATVGTGGAAGSVVEVTPTASVSTFTAGAQPTFVLTGTSTASGQALPTLEVWFEVQELFS